MATQIPYRVLPTFLPDGREVDLQYDYQPAVPGFYSPDPVKGGMDCWPEPAAVCLYDVVTVEGRSILAELDAKVQGALEAECLADALGWEARRVR